MLWAGNRRQYHAKGGGSSEGILPESLLESYAEYYFAELAVKVKRGLTENVLKGKWNGGQYPSNILKDELYI